MALFRAFGRFDGGRAPAADGAGQELGERHRPGHDRRYAIDAGKIERDLGWTPRETFESGMEKTVRWYLENRGWCESVAARGYRQERLGLGGRS